jgi:hypothetical protein
MGNIRPKRKEPGIISDGGDPATYRENFPAVRKRLVSAMAFLLTLSLARQYDPRVCPADRDGFSAWVSGSLEKI